VGDSGTYTTQTSVEAAVSVAGELGLKFSRASQRINSGLDDEIRTARVVLCDFTEGFSGAYYAAGLSEPLGKLLIGLCHDSAKKKLDVGDRRFPVLYWSSAEDLARGLKTIIKARI
jgi:hypothetical protein